MPVPLNATDGASARFCVSETICGAVQLPLAPARVATAIVSWLPAESSETHATTALPEPSTARVGL